ncbi:t-SNARE [Peniophora sp. CONT]|nr:t-SNARE [Peniophora sp. CONT]
MAELQEPNKEVFSYGDGSHYNQAASADSNAAFFSEVLRIQDELHALKEHVAHISNLRAQTLKGADDSATGKQNEGSLDESVEETRGIIHRIRGALWELQKQQQPSGNQIKLLGEQFVEALQAYQRVEQDYKERYKQRTGRQFEIIKPDATPEEVRAVVENDGGEQIFQQAVMNANVSGQSIMVYRELQERYGEIQKIERTLAELAQIFDDMGMLANQQEKDGIDTGLCTIEVNVDVRGARAARRRRWFCFGICALVVVALALGFGIGFGLSRKG